MNKEQVIKLLAECDANRNDYESWFGQDGDLGWCLDYGLVMKAMPLTDEYSRYQFKCYHLITKGENGNRQWYYDVFDYKLWLEELLDGSTYKIGNLANLCGMSEEEYLKHATPCNLLSDLISYYGICEITDYGRALKCLIDEDEVLQELGIKDE